MEISVSALLLFLHPAFPKLIVDPGKEDQLSTEFLLDEAELVKSYQQPGLCENVQEEVQPSFFWKEKVKPCVREALMKKKR